MPRPRTVPDADLLDAALSVVHSAGPDALTFAAAAQRCGLAPSTLVQRFGSKAGLLHATLARAWDLLEQQTAAAAARAGDGQEGVVALLVELSATYTVHDVADQLRVLREDLRDPVLRARGQVWLDGLGRELERRLGPGSAGLGRLLLAQWQGTLTVWSFTRDTEPDTDLHSDLRSTVRAALTDLLARLR